MTTHDRDATFGSVRLTVVACAQQHSREVDRARGTWHGGTSRCTDTVVHASRVMIQEWANAPLGIKSGRWQCDQSRIGRRQCCASFRSVARGVPAAEHSSCTA
eukprot:5232028-Prymnesium_polylepis.1